MRPLGIAALLLCMVAPLMAQNTDRVPANPKAQKTYMEALRYLKERLSGAALGDFKKADKQDDFHCVACQKMMVKYGEELGDWKTAETGAEELVTEAQGDHDIALAHYQFASILMGEGTQKRKVEFFARAHDEFSKALALGLNSPEALFADGRALAQMEDDKAARTRFEQFAKLRPEGDPERQRALRYISDPDLARARMAPPFEITTADAQRVSLDDLQGKVVLLDFWATWCRPCREALPHIQRIAKKFQGEPLVILSISLDKNEKQWRDFIVKNEMTWLQYCDGGFPGPLATKFGIKAIPHTFTIDADGVLQDEHIGDAALEGKLKKLLARAREIPAGSTPSTPSAQSQ